MNKKSVFGMSFTELIALILLASFLIFVLFPLAQPLLARLRHQPNPKIQHQFKELVVDIKGTPNDEQVYSYAFAVNKDKVDYQLKTYRACTGDQKPEQDTCLETAKLCLIHIKGEQEPLCEEIENINFRTDFTYTPRETNIKIKKDKDGIVEIIT